MSCRVASFMLLLGLASLLPAHAARQVLQSGPGGCVASPDSQNEQSGVGCIGVVQVSQEDCQNIAMYQGTAIPNIEDDQNAVCYIPYNSDCPSSITILYQEGNGQFTNCDDQTTSTANAFVESLLSDLQAELQGGSGSSTSAGSDPSTSSLLTNFDEGLTQDVGDMTTSFDTDEENLSEEGISDSGNGV